MVALGSPGGSTIITTVLQILVNEIDFGRALPDALAAPRASQRNTRRRRRPSPRSSRRTAGRCTARGHQFTVVTPDPPAEIGAATGIRFLHGGRQQSVAEPTRRGGGSAMVVRPG